MKKVIEKLFSEQEQGNSIVSCLIGFGACGLEVARWSKERIQELETLRFDGEVYPCFDIEYSGYYDESCVVYQFAYKGTLVLQVMLPKRD